VLDVGGWSTLRPGRFTPGKDLLYRTLGGPQGWSGRVRRNSPQPGFDPRTVKPVARPGNSRRHSKKCSRHGGLGSGICVPLDKCMKGFSRKTWREHIALETFLPLPPPSILVLYFKPPYVIIAERLSLTIEGENMYIFHKMMPASKIELKKHVLSDT